MMPLGVSVSSSVKWEKITFLTRSLNAYCQIYFKHPAESLVYRKQ